MAAMRVLLAVLLGIEALNAVLWASRIVSTAAAQDALVLLMVTLRIIVSAVQAAAAWMLMSRALPAVTFARWAFGASAVLLVFEIGLRLAPSSVQPGLREPLVAAYVLYALAGIRALGWIERSGRRPDGI